MESRQGLTISRLIVKAADQTDTGDYACSSDAGSSNSTAIHVITGTIFSYFHPLRVWQMHLREDDMMNMMQISRLI